MGQRVLITGSNRGIGLALARHYLRRGDTVLAGCRRPRAAKHLAALRKQHPDACHVLRLDVNDDESVAGAAERAADRLDGLDVLINNAAVGSVGDEHRLAGLDLAASLGTFRTNVLGPLRVARAFLPLLKRGCHPRVVNISSGAGRIAGRTGVGLYIYGASKAALNFVTRSLAFELKADGVCVIAMSPGWVRTDMGGPNARIAPATSARGIVKTTDGLTLRHTACWLTYEGSRHKTW